MFRVMGTHNKRGHLINNVKDLVKPQNPLFFNLVICKDIPYEEPASRPVTSHGCDRNCQSYTGHLATSNAALAKQIASKTRINI